LSGRTGITPNTFFLQYPPKVDVASPTSNAPNSSIYPTENKEVREFKRNNDPKIREG
jgi:hypothetical protein